MESAEIGIQMRLKHPKDRTHCIHGHLLDTQNTYTLIKPDGALRRSCRTCSREKAARYYDDPNKRARIRARQKQSQEKWAEKYKVKATKRRHEIRAYLRTLKTQCVRCPENNPDCLDFHHIDPLQKKFTIASIGGNATLEYFLAEVAKCEVLCANCHRKEEAVRRRERNLCGASNCLQS